MRTVLKIAPLSKGTKHRYGINCVKKYWSLGLKHGRNATPPKGMKTRWLKKKQQSNTSKIIKAVKRNFDKNQLSQIQNDFKKHNTKNFYKTFKNMHQQYQTPSLF